jgi:hypothetical protein
MLDKINIINYLSKVNFSKKKLIGRPNLLAKTRSEIYSTVTDFASPLGLSTSFPIRRDIL